MKADSLLPASKNTPIIIMEFPGMLLYCIVVVLILFISVLNFLTWMVGEH